MSISQILANFYTRNRHTRLLGFSSRLGTLEEIRFMGRRLDLIGLRQPVMKSFFHSKFSEGVRYITIGVTQPPSFIGVKWDKLIISGNYEESHMLLQEKLLFVSPYRINTLNVRLTADVPGENTGNQNGQHVLIHDYEMSFSATQQTPGVATDYELYGRDSITGRDRDFSLLHSAHTGSENHSTSYPMRTGVPLPGGKVAGA